MSFESRTEKTSNPRAMIGEAADKLKQSGEYSVELSVNDFGELIRASLPEALDALRSKGIEAEIKKFDVRIENQEGTVELQVSGSKKVFLKKFTADITAKMKLRNSEGGKGRLETTSFDVQPESLYGLVNLREKLVPYLEGERLNDALVKALGGQLSAMGVELQSVSLEFTPKNTLSIAVTSKKS